MGNSISISFRKRNGSGGRMEKGVVLYSHWQGRRLLLITCSYLEHLRATNWARRSCGTMPLDRLEPRAVMVDFIRWMTCAMPHVAQDLYLDSVRGDSRALHHGHFTFDLDRWRFIEHDTGRTYRISTEARRTVREGRPDSLRPGYIQSGDASAKQQ